MSDPFIGQITMFAGNFAPRNWAFCDGQLLAIAQNSALFSLLGTTYGGDGRTTFGLPDLRGRFAMHAGSGPGLTTRAQGLKAGSETHTISASQLPQHNHTVSPPAASGEGQTTQPTGNYPAAGEEPTKPYTDAADTAQAAFVTSNAGSSLPVDHMNPFVTVRFIIALAGIFPSRN